MTASGTILRIRHADGTTTDLALCERSEYVIGRKPGQTQPHHVPVTLSDPFASRNHCRIFMVQAKAAQPSLLASFLDDDDATLLLDSPQSATQSGWHVEDMGSANGTTLDNHPLIQAKPLPPQGVIRIGSSAITLVTPHTPSQAPPPPRKRSLIATLSEEEETPSLPKTPSAQTRPPQQSLIATLLEEEEKKNPSPPKTPSAKTRAPQKSLIATLLEESEEDGEEEESPPPPQAATPSRPPPAPPPPAFFQSAPSATPQGGMHHGPSTISELLQLAELRDKGILTAEEFQEQKKRLLNLSVPVASAVSDLPQVDEHGCIIEASGEPAFVVEAGTFSRTNIQEAVMRIQPLNLPIFRRFINIQNTIFYLLHIGPYSTEEDARQAANFLLYHKSLEELPGCGNCRVAPVQELTRAEGRFDKRRPIQAGWPGIP